MRGMAMPIVLSIAGYDPSSGAGITADVKTAAAHECYAITCITAVTVQTTEKVFAVEPLRAEIVRDTLYELVRDMPPAAVRIGMLGSGEVAEVVADFLETTRLRNVVLDPVLRSTSGAALIDERGEQVIRARLLKAVDVCTPNEAEARVLAECEASPEGLARELHRKGCPAVVITGGEREDSGDLLSFGDQQEWLRAEKIRSRATHGTGCAFATAIACNLALGRQLREAVVEAKFYVRRAITLGSDEPLGHGRGPMNHFV